MPVIDFNGARTGGAASKRSAAQRRALEDSMRRFAELTAMDPSAVAFLNELADEMIRRARRRITAGQPLRPRPLQAISDDLDDLAALAALRYEP